MNDLRLKTHYMYFVPIIILQVISGFGFSLALSLEDYGLFTLYLTTISFFTFTSLGANIGFSLNNRNKQLENLDNARNTIIQYVGIQVIIESIVLLVQLIMGVEPIYYILGLSIFFMSIYDYVRYYYLTFNFAHKVNILTLVLRLLIVIEIPLYLITGKLLIILLFDMIVRMVIATVGLLDIYIIAPRNKQLDSQRFQAVQADIKTGFPVMISSLLFASSLMFDKYALASDLESLAIYSFAISIVLIIRMLIKPLSDVLFVRIEKDYSSVQYGRITKKVLYITFPCVMAISLGAVIVITNFDIFDKFQDSVNLIVILALMIPLMIPLESILINLNKLKPFKFLFTKVILAASLSLLTLFAYARLSTDINLTIFAGLVVGLYILYYLIFSYKIINLRVVTENLLIYALLSGGYIIVFSLLI